MNEMTLFERYLNDSLNWCDEQIETWHGKRPKLANHYMSYREAILDMHLKYTQLLKEEQNQ